MLELNPHALSSDKARTLLRKLRDLNLFAGPVAVTRDLEVMIAGCLSLDGPAESGVRYRLRTRDGAEGQMEISWDDSSLELSAIGPQQRMQKKCLRVRLSCDRNGRAFARELGARVSPDSCDERELEHFLRRVVRTLFKG